MPTAETRQDSYAWLQTPTLPATEAFLAQEQAHLEQYLASTTALQQRLFDEISARYQDSDLFTPTPLGDWLYYFRKHAGETYSRYYRSPPLAGGALLEPDPTGEQLLLDPNLLAGDGRIAFGALSISPGGQYLAYSLWAGSGDGLFVLNMATGEQSAVSLPTEPFDGTVVWANDNQTLLFGAGQHSQQLYRYRLGEAQPEKVFEEQRSAYRLRCSRSSSGHWLLLHCLASDASDTWVLPADAPGGQFQALPGPGGSPRGELDHGLWGEQWCWLHRASGAGVTSQVDCASAEASPALAGPWQPLVAPRAGVSIEAMAPKRSALVLSVRNQGLPQVEIHRAGTPAETVGFGDQQAYQLAVRAALPFDSPAVVLALESFTQPPQTQWLALPSAERQVLKTLAVQGNFDPERYATRRLWATAADGTAIPISLVMRRDHLERGPQRLLLQVYGAYGVALEPSFSHAGLSLIDRGFSLAIAHVRGGGTLGPAWHAGGRGALKQHSIDDFIACSEYLIEQGWTTAQGLVIHGHSAGGLVVGAALNQRPELFAAAIARQPFVDPLTAMLDPTLRLTELEYEEWGDPRGAEAYAWIAGWSPYENARAQAYPPLLATGAMGDTVVPYWHPAKWVAKLREQATGGGEILLAIDPEGAHGQPLGRYERIRQDALEYAFMLKALGLADHL
ncbi:prolyl oligopeptidase family serine peptidase [Pseudomonas sp. NPDC007930]|uniref:prolyl oligopeptidase family serine peptidase n=1 Tax=Pseudomonas sp. NPDC007930 TaxID=3364417 RepID=UPI0036EBD157